jgi:hypothetical protein
VNYQGPADPVTPAGEVFAAMHEVFTGLREAGFSLAEAAAVVAAIVMRGQE